MEKCTIYHTGVGSNAEGVIKNSKVYLKGEGSRVYFPEELFMAREECEGGLIQFEVEGKWGFADIYTGEILIEPVWDYAGPFYGGYAHVALGMQMELHHGYDMAMEGGKHGYINTKGEIIIPIEYEEALDIPSIDHKYFEVRKNKKWGLLNAQNKIVMPFHWDRLKINYRNNLIFCAIEEACEMHIGPEDRLIASIFNIEAEPTCHHTLKWGVYDKQFQLIVQPDLDEEPTPPKRKSNPRSSSFSYDEKYYILQRGKKYGLLCEDGRWIANIELSKKQAENMLNTICKGREAGNLYI